MPYIGTISVLTFNLINSLAKYKTRSNALFWLPVWLTAEVQGSSAGVTGTISYFRMASSMGWAAGRGQWRVDRGP